MNDNDELLAEIRTDVAGVRETGQEVISVAALETYLADLAAAAAMTKEERQHHRETQLEHYKATLASNLAQWTAERQMDVELFRSTIGYGTEALKSAMLVNGGAAVAVLGFLSAAASKGPHAGMMANLPIALLFFAFGALATAVAVGLTYVSQGFFARRRDRIGEAVRVVVFVLMIGSYCAFALGSVQAYLAFQH